MRHVMSPLDFTTDELEQLFDLAADIEKNPQKYAHKCDGKKLATCFYEPSTRKRFRYDPRYFLFCRYLRHAPSKGRCADGRSCTFPYPGHQRR